MLRGFKLRAYHKEFKKVLDVIMIDFSTDRFMLANTDDVIKLGAEVQMFDCYIKDIVLLRPTGLYDKNKNSIYEGDIIKAILPEWDDTSSSYHDYDGEEVYDKIPERTIYGEVRIRNAMGAGFICRKQEDEDEENPNIKNRWFKIHQDKDEVIGNIYENPELINK